MELSCECGNETDFLEVTLISFNVDGEGNREDKITEDTKFECRVCGEPAEVCNGD